MKVAVIPDAAMIIIPLIEKMGMNTSPPLTFQSTIIMRMKTQMINWTEAELHLHYMVKGY